MRNLKKTDRNYMFCLSAISVIFLLFCGCDKGKVFLQRPMTSEDGEKRANNLPWKVSNQQISTIPYRSAKIQCGVDDRPDRGKNGVYVYREWWQDKLKNTKPELEKIFAGISFYPEHELGIFYTQTIDSKKQIPVYRQYGDRFMSFRSVAKWGWNFQNFITITLEKDGKQFTLRRKYILSDIYIMEQEGERTVADFVFKLDGANNFVGIRCIVYADKPTWLWGEVYVAGTQYRLCSVGLSSFGGHAGSNYPYRQRWFAGLTEHLRIEKANFKLDLKKWPMLIIHHKNAYGNRGSLGIFETEALESMLTGYRGGGVNLIPKSNIKRVRFGIADYNKPDEQIIKRMRQKWPEYKKFFARINWDVDFRNGTAFADKVKTNMGKEFLLSVPGKELIKRYKNIKKKKLVSAKNTRIQELKFGKEMISLIKDIDKYKELATKQLIEKKIRP